MSLILVFSLTRALRSTSRRVALGDSREDVYGTSTLNSTSSSGSSSSGLETRRRQDRSNLFSMDFYFLTCDSFFVSFYSIFIFTLFCVLFLARDSFLGTNCDANLPAVGEKYLLLFFCSFCDACLRVGFLFSYFPFSNRKRY